MTKSEFIKECTEVFEAGDCIEFSLVSDGSTVVIAESEYWVGGIEGHYGCDILGNVVYDDYEWMVEVVADYVYDELKDEVEEVYPC